MIRIEIFIRYPDALKPPIHKVLGDNVCCLLHWRGVGNLLPGPIGIERTHSFGELGRVRPKVLLEQNTRMIDESPCRKADGDRTRRPSCVLVARPFGYSRESWTIPPWAIWRSQLHFGDLVRHHKFRFGSGDDWLN